MTHPTVGAIVVTFFPARETFIPLIEQLSQQCTKIYVIDNSPNHSANCVQAQYPYLSRSRNIELHSLGKNHGVAYALNVGCRSALRDGMDYFLLSDQDSLPQRNMIPNLLKATLALESKGSNVAAVGPTFVDQHTGHQLPFQSARTGKLLYRKSHPSKETPYVNALTLITSGTLLSKHAFQKVGPMREDFFIDYIDSEWCQRARSIGFSLYGIGNAHMLHRMGEDGIDVWFVKWRRETLYQPSRVYYRSRNFIAMARMRHVDKRWKIRGSWYLLGCIYSHVVFSNKRFQSAKMAAIGFWDGIRRKMGPLPEASL